MNVLNEDYNLIQNHIFDANLGKFLRYELGSLYTYIGTLVRVRVPMDSSTSDS